MYRNNIKQRFHRVTPTRRLAVAGLLVGLTGIGLAAVLSFVIGCEPQAVREPAPPGTLTILFSADNLGVLSSCGCASNPSGGFAKRQTAIEDARRKRPAGIMVDAGDMFNDRPNSVKVKYLSMALGRAKYDAVALGEREFQLGVKELQAIQHQYDLPLICANVRDEAGQFIVPPHVIRQVAGLRVGIFAVIADKPLGPPARDWRGGLKIEPPIDAARREVADLAGCDVIVALSHQPIEDTRALAAAVPGIQVVVSGHDEMVFRKPQQIGDTLIVGTGPIGRLLGALTYRRGEGGHPVAALDLVGLSERVDDTKWVMDLYWQYVKQARNEPPPTWEFAAVPASYEPAEDCRACHADEYFQWSGTAHAHAYETLEKAKRQDDPECILCHTVGYGREGGFISMAKTPALGRVTCQACHPVTSAHGLSGAKKDPNLDVRANLSSRVCLPCHGLIESPDFDYQVYKPRIEHLHPAAEKK